MRWRPEQRWGTARVLQIPSRQAAVTHITEDLLHVAYVPQTKRTNAKCPKAPVPDSKWARRCRRRTWTDRQTNKWRLKFKAQPWGQIPMRRSHIVWLSPGSPWTSLKVTVSYGTFLLFTLDNIHHHKHSLDKSLRNTATPSGLGTKFRICHHTTNNITLCTAK